MSTCCEKAEKRGWKLILIGAVLMIFATLSTNMSGGTVAPFGSMNDAGVVRSLLNFLITIILLAAPIAILYFAWKKENASKIGLIALGIVAVNAIYIIVDTIATHIEVGDTADASLIFTRLYLAAIVSIVTSAILPAVVLIGVKKLGWSPTNININISTAQAAPEATEPQ